MPLNCGPESHDPGCSPWAEANQAPRWEADHAAGLTDSQLLQVFKQTSIFNVRSALAGNHSLMDDGGADGMDRWNPCPFLLQIAEIMRRLSYCRLGCSPAAVGLGYPKP